MRAGIVAAVVVFIIGTIFGQSLAGEPEVRYRLVEKKVEVPVVRTETVTTPIPAACGDLLKYSKRIAKAGSQYDQSSADILDIISELRIALAAQDPNRATALENRLRQVDGTTVGAAESLGITLTQIENAAAGCQP